MSKWMAVVVAVLTAAGALIPAVAWAYGQKAGPCTVSVRCVSGSTISCSGQRVCYWRGDSTTYGGGFVQCDSQPAINCPGTEWVDEESELEFE
jgi:hypothetical protein